jgi:hypothetical protein
MRIGSSRFFFSHAVTAATIGRGVALASTAALLLCCASDGDAPHPRLASAWLSYRQLPAERALAIAGDPRGNRWVTGASGGHASVGEARTSALEQCRLRRAARRLRDACVLYAVGDEIVWPGP